MEILFDKEHYLFYVLGSVMLIAIIVLLLLFITYKLKQEKKMKQSNDWLLHVLKAMHDQVVVVNAELRITDVFNPQEQILLGTEAEEMIGLPIRSLGKLNPLFEAVVDLIAEKVEETFRTHENRNFRYEVVKGDQSYHAAVRTTVFMGDKVICFLHDETDTVELERKTIAQHHFFQSIVDNLPVGLLVKEVTDDFRFVFFNNHLLDFYGNDKPFLLGQNEYDREDFMAEKFMEEDRRVVAGGKAVSFDRMVCNEETGMPERWQITTKNCFKGIDGKEYLVAATIETTESKRKDFELIRAQQQLTLVLEAGRVSAWVYDINTSMYSAINGKPLVGEGMSLTELKQLAHPEDREHHSEIIELLVSGKENKVKRVSRFLFDGKVEWYEIHAIAMRSEKTGELYQILGTEQVITEDVIRQKALEEANTKLNVAFYSAQMVLWEYNYKTRMFYREHDNGVAPQEHTHEEMMSFFHPNDVPLFQSALEGLFNGKQTFLNLHLRIQYPQQEKRWYELHAAVSERDSNGRVVKISGVRRDITAQKMTDELIELREKAEHSNRLKSAFLANMSHEIRTPLNAIVGFSQLIVESEDREEKDEYSQIIGTNNELLLQLISDILDVSKIEAGEMDFIFTEFTVGDIFDTLERTYMYRLQEGVKLVKQLPPHDCHILSERNRLTQVVSNFLSNAVKFTSSGTITMGYHYTHKGLRFFVRDTGKGIAKENIPNVFNRFAKFDTFVQGTGLGLAISKYIVEYLNGEIGLKSELGKGTEFWFEIPCEPIGD